MATKEQSICEGINWISITDPSKAEMEALSTEYGLNQHIVKDCMEPEHLPKYEFVDDVHFLILRFYARDAGKRNTTIQDITNKIAIFFTDRFLISIHKSEISFVKVIREKFVSTGRCSTPIDVVARIIWNTLETYEDPANRLAEQIDFYENQIIRLQTHQDQLEALYLIKREASLSNKVLLLLREPINHVHPQEENQSAIQDVRDQHLKMLTLYNQVLEDVNNLMNMYMSFTAQKTNDVVKVLTIFSVFFMPLTFIVGIYGMNFDFMPELNKKWGYPAVLVIMIIITAIIYFWFKRKKWL
ncbi:MAG: magnesium transporter CorA [Chitinophagaceae bacterium]|nr:magnesium transporter CorA [Chitinophagaceae bacterium]